MIKDYFGNEIEVGDIVLRNCNSTFYITKVLRITPISIGLERTVWQAQSRNRPLYVQYFSGINLSKLDNSQIQETIKNYINEI